MDDTEAGATLRIHFDRSVLPFTFLFLAYGGWRDCYTAVLEPCTNMYKDLAASVRAGYPARLEPGDTFRAEFRVVVAEFGR